MTTTQTTETIDYKGFPCMLEAREDGSFRIVVQHPDGGWFSTGAYLWNTRDEAVAYAQKTIDRYLMTLISRLPSREEYVSACEQAAVSPFADEEIENMAYGMEYGNYYMSQYSLPESVRMILAQARYRAIKATRAAAPQPAVPVRDLVPCPNCGEMVAPVELMAASLGTSCPNCYDELSN